MFNKVLQNMQFNGTPLSVVVESASLGPSFPQHDPRVIRLAREAGLKLAPKNTRSFKEVRDTVEYDLILVMDRFDFEEVGYSASLDPKIWLHMSCETLIIGIFQRRQIQRFDEFPYMPGSVSEICVL